MIMTGLALTIFTVLAAIAALHFYWAFGGLWPSDSIKGADQHRGWQPWG